MAFLLFACEILREAVCYAQKDCVMVLRKHLFLFVGALGWAWCGSAADGWLTPAHRADAPYRFAAGATLKLPNREGWTVFNAGSSAAEAEADYAAAAENDPTYTPGTLLFSPPETLQEDEQAYLTLGIRDMDGVSRIEMRPANPAVARMRTDRIHATLRLIPSDATPDIAALKKMYPSYAESQPGPQGPPIPTAAKLGLCVLQDGHFYVSRVRGNGKVDETSGVPEDFVFEFCQSKVRYEDAPEDTPAEEKKWFVGNGDVTICLEFRTFQLPPSEEGGMAARPPTRAFRILVKPADQPDSAYVSLTAGRGYAWAEQMSDQGLDYAFDWSSFEASDASEWMYAFDGVMPFFETDEITYDLDTLNTISEMGFSASEGGLISAWLEMDRSVQTAADLEGLDAGAFAPYLDMNSSAFNAYADWAATYDVTLQKYLRGKQKRLARAANGGSPTLTDEAFDAFLLYMDPESTTARRLLITGMVPEGDTVTLTVRGPEGSDLAAALQKGISHIRFARAATLEELASAAPKLYPVHLDGAGNATLVLPKQENGRELPFMKAELVSALPKAE